MKRRGSTGSAGDGQKSAGRSSGRKPVGSTIPPPPVEVAHAISPHLDGPGAITGPIDTLPEDYLSCTACSDILLPKSSSWYILGECHHIVCPHCWGTHCNAERGCRTYMTCPRSLNRYDANSTSCDSPYSYSFYVSDVKPIDTPDKPTDRKTRRQIKKAKAAAAQDGPPPLPPLERRLAGPIYLDPPDALKDPYRHYTYAMDADARKDNMVISMAWPTVDTDSGDACTKVVSTRLPASMDKDLNNEQQMVLRNIMLKLHTPIMNHDKRQWVRRKEELSAAGAQLTSNVLDVDAKESEDILPDMLHALGCGSMRMNDRAKADDSRHRTQFFIPYAAASILRMCNQSRPTLFQDVLSQAAILFGLPVAFYFLLRRYSMVSSRDVVNLKNIDQVCDRIKKGWDVRRSIWGTMVFVYDNVGFKVRGVKVGYDQFTHVVAIFIPPSFLERFGVYSEGKVGRERRAWQSLRNQMEVEDLMPSSIEYDLFHRRILTTFSSIMDIYKNLPDLEKSRLLLQKWRDSGKKQFESGGTRVPAEFANRPKAYRRAAASQPDAESVPVECADNNNDNDDDNGIRVGEVIAQHEVRENEVQDAIEDDEDDEIAVEQGLPLMADLNCDSTVTEIARQVSTYREKTLALYRVGVEDGSISEHRNGELPVLHDTPAFAASDGAPAYAWHKLAAMKKSVDPFAFSKNFCGGLHTLMMVLKAIGYLFTSSILVSLIMPYRPTEKQQEWVTQPSDPTQCLREMYQQFAGLLADAIEKTALYKMESTSATNDSSADDTITAADVYEHMIRNAMGKKLSLIALTQICFYEVVFMICDSEKTGATKQGTKGCDPELYRAATKFALFIAAVSGSWKYVWILCEFNIFWLCSSELDKILWEEILFTKATKNGKRVFLDRFMEWTVKDIRSYLGKYSASNMWQRMLRTTASLKDRSSFKTEGMKSEGSFEPTTQEYELTIVFCVSRVWSDDVNLWGSGPNCTVTTTGETNECSEDEFVGADGKSQLNEEMLYLVSTAQRRLSKYWKEYYLNGEPHRYSRPHSIVNLRKIPALSSEKNAADTLVMTWATSTDEEQLRTFGKADIMANAEYVNSLLPEEKQRTDLPKAYKSRPVHAKALAELRTELKEIKESKGETPKFLDDEVDDADNISFSVKDELEQRFYNITEAVKSEFITRAIPIYDNVVGPFVRVEQASDASDAETNMPQDDGNGTGTSQSQHSEASNNEPTDSQRTDFTLSL